MNYTKEKIEQLRHRWTTPKGKKLLKAIKTSRCYLSPILFRETVTRFPGINDEEVQNSIDLRGVPLSGLDFRSPIQEDDEGFSEEMAILSNIHFEGAILKHCNFEGGKLFECNFEESNLSHTSFNGATINTCSFREANCTGLDLHATKLINCDFTNATIKDISLDRIIVDEKTTFGHLLKSEKEGRFHFASIEYKQIKEMYKDSSLHKQADNYHYKELIAKRRTSPKSSPMRWMNFFFGDLLCRYGTSFIRVLLWSGVTIVGCAFIFTIKDGLYFQNTPITANFTDSLYFSIVTFTTLGYGDYHAMGAIRFIAAFESFIGAALMALFTVIVARNIIRD